MTTGVLSDQIIINGKIFNDIRAFHTADINTQMDSHSTTVVSRTTFYTQWALANAGFYTGPIDGKPGSGGSTALFDAFVALYDSQYDGGSFSRPSNGHVSFAFYKEVMFEQSSVDTTIYKVVD